MVRPPPPLGTALRGNTWDNADHHARPARLVVQAPPGTGRTEIARCATLSCSPPRCRADEVRSIRSPQTSGLAWQLPYCGLICHEIS